jgi:mevalonate kinase
MLLGEHAVLHGRRALVCAVDKRMRVSVTPRTGRTARVVSALGRYEADLDRLRPDPRLRFVLEVLRTHAGELDGGLDMSITSEFPETIGFGSSASVTVAATAAVRALLGHADDEAEPMRVFREGLDVVRAVQRVGSGADLAASVYGGMVVYRADPVEVSPLGRVHPITAVYSGRKVPTVEVIRKVDALRSREPERVNRVFEAMDESVGQAVACIEEANWPVLGEILDRNHDLMDALGLNTPELAAIVSALRARQGILGAKISGAGLGDCAVGLGTAEGADLPGEPIPAAMSREGLRRE